MASQFHRAKVCSEIFTAKHDSNAFLVAQEGMLLLIEVLKKPSLASECQGAFDFHGRNNLAARQTTTSIYSPLTR